MEWNHEYAAGISMGKKEKKNMLLISSKKKLGKKKEARKGKSTEGIFRGCGV